MPRVIARKVESGKRNVAFDRSDYEWFSRAARNHFTRQRTALIRYLISEWKAGRAVLLQSPNGKVASK
jgi:hypothetical protein